MKILYLSALSSERLIEQIYKQTGSNPGFAFQKFSRLLVKGLLANNADVIALSNPIITPQTDKRRWINLGTDEENGVTYKYAPFINLPILKHICVFLYIFFYVLGWGLQNRSKKAIVCDVLNISVCLGALLASKLNGVTSVAVVTDLYQHMAGRQGFIMSLAAKVNSLYVSSFDKYVLLTEQMNEIVNPHKRPYIVMEGLCDSTISDEQVAHVEKDNPRTIIYAGGLHEKYGLKMLIEGFLASCVDAVLKIYGDGPFVPALKEYCVANSSIKYMGVCPNNVVVEDELKATLLVNPRFTTEELTKYSFPSKNMEYMTTGTPLLTTNLPGMPTEYHPYVFLIEEESVKGFARAIDSALNCTEHELINKGRNAREFVMFNKNNKIQAGRILNFIEKK